jgi:hypothetical protein
VVSPCSTARTTYLASFDPTAGEPGRSCRARIGEALPRCTPTGTLLMPALLGGARRRVPVAGIFGLGAAWNRRARSISLALGLSVRHFL